MKPSSIRKPGRGFFARPRGSACCKCICRAASRARGAIFVEITAAAHAAGLYTNLITSAVGITAKTLQKLGEGGLDHVQISIQDSEPESADHIAGYEGAFARKQALAAEVVRLKIPLTVNAVMHRANIDRIEDMVALALKLGATPRRDRARAILRLGTEEPHSFDAEQRAG